MKYKKKSISDILRHPQTIFSFKDLFLIWNDTDTQNTISSIYYYIKTGQLYRIRKGVYAKDKNYDRFELAVKILSPAYVSFETVLGNEGVIFQKYSSIFVASYQSKEIIADNQTFNFKKLKDSLLTNNAGIKAQGNYPIASLERAFLDVLYLNKDYHFDSLSRINWDIIFKILPIYGGNKRMAKMVNNYYNSFKQG